MGQDFKCALGMHKLEVQEKLDVEDTLGIIGVNFVCRCKECGKIKSFFVPTSDSYINRSTKA